MRALVLLTIAAVPAFVPAQGLFELSTGGRYEGRIAGLSDRARIETAVGRLPLPADVKALRRDPFEAHERVALAAFALSPDNVMGNVAVAEFAAGQGVWTVARRHLNQALAVDPDSDRALALAARWAARFQLTQFEDGPRPNPRKAFEAWLKEAAPMDWVGAAMVQEKAKGFGPDVALHPSLKSLKADAPHVRWCAARILTNFRTSPDRIKPLYVRGVLDPSPVVRTACVRALKVTQDPVFCKLYARSLASRNQAVRIAAAEALSELELPPGAEPLVRMLSGDLPVAPRNHIAQTTQVAYVKDFDVQVAQNAVIADPVVDVAQEGMVLDVAVVSVQTERDVYWSALRRITKQDFGRDLAKWRAYLKIGQGETAGG